MIAEWIKVDESRPIKGLEAAAEKLDTASGQVFLDFSAVRRIAPEGLRAMEALAAQADEKAVKVSLRGVNIDIYKVLKLTRLAPRFSFLT